MAILVVRIAPNGLSNLRTQPGDVVEIVEDGHEFTLTERNCGQYRFVSVPGAEVDYSHLKQAKYVGEDMVARRGHTLDLPSLGERTSTTRGELDALVRTR